MQADNDTFNAWYVNNHSLRNTAEDGTNLVKKIDVKNVELLESYHELRKYAVETIEQIKTIYRMKLRVLKRGEQC